MPAKRYDIDYKIQAVKLADEIGLNKAAKEIGVPASTLHGWITAANEGRLQINKRSNKPTAALSMAEEIARLKAENKALAKENKYLKEVNDFLEEASTFFAASRQKSTKSRD